MSVPNKKESPLFEDNLDSVIFDKLFIPFCKIKILESQGYLGVSLEYVKSDICDGQYTEFYNIINEDCDIISAKITEKEAFYIPYGKKKYKSFDKISEKEREKLHTLLYAM